MHQPLKRIVPGAANAVLFVHGIMATPRFFDDFAAIIPRDWSVHSVLLPGHGGTVKDFGRHSAKEWEAHVHACLEELRGQHQQVYIVAHSLGTLLAIREAVQDSTRIAGMLLLCVPLRIWSKPSAWVSSIRKGLFPGKHAAELRTYCGIETDWRIWHYIGWISRFRELFALSADTRKQVSQLTVPTHAFMAGRDEQVSLRSERFLSGNPVITLHRMPDSHHHIFLPEDKATLLATLRAMGGFN